MANKFLAYLFKFYTLTAWFRARAPPPVSGASSLLRWSNAPRRSDAKDPAYLPWFPAPRLRYIVEAPNHKIRFAVLFVNTAVADVAQLLRLTLCIIRYMVVFVVFVVDVGHLWWCFDCEMWWWRSWGDSAMNVGMSRDGVYYYIVRQLSLLRCTNRNLCFMWMCTMMCMVCSWVTHAVSHAQRNDMDEEEEGAPTHSTAQSVGIYNNNLYKFN